MAPKGAAAVNIDGFTIHSCLRIPITGEMIPLNGENLRTFQLQFQDVKFIIIDEYSMIGMRLLHKIHRRITEASGIAAEPFGGFFIYILGDLRQLPPVRDTAIYMEPVDDSSTIGKRLIRSMTKRVILQTCFRQRYDEQQFRNVLDDIGKGQNDREGWELLMSRRTAMVPSWRALFSDAIRLFPTNVQVAEFNKATISHMSAPVAVIDAIHKNATSRQASELLAQGLSRKLHLSIGCRVMLRKNISVHQGLVNGSLGTVRDIIFNPGERPPMMPSVILVEFDKFLGPYLTDQRVFPILPVTANWRDSNVDCSRRQFPLTLAYALTIHKAQGLTLDKAIVDIGEKENASGLTYVALSPVRSIEHLIIYKPFDFTRLSGIGRTPSARAREQFLIDMARSSRQ